MRELGQAVAVPHGLRSTFRDWAGEETYRRVSGLKRQARPSVGQHAAPVCLSVDWRDALGRARAGG